MMSSALCLCRDVPLLLLGETLGEDSLVLFDLSLLHFGLSAGEGA